MTDTRTPTVIVVGGTPGTGKTRLAHALARQVACPAICRDEMKEGMVHAYGEFQPAAGDPLTQRTLSVFFELLEMLVNAGVTVVAEAAFQDRLWRAGLEPVVDRADFRIVSCTTDAATARARIAARRAEGEPSRTAHAEILDLDKLDEDLRFVRTAVVRRTHHRGRTPPTATCRTSTGSFASSTRRRR